MNSLIFAFFFSLNLQKMRSIFFVWLFLKVDQSLCRIKLLFFRLSWCCSV